MSNLKIEFRKPIKSDTNAYFSIYKNYQFDHNRQKNKKYLLEIKKKGFLLGSSYPETYWNKAIYSECAVIEKKPVGFIRADKMTNEMSSENFVLNWLGNRKLWKMFTREKGCLVGVIFVDPKFKGKGISKLLYERLENFMKKSGCRELFSWVATKPKNKPSFRFHEKMGFKIVAVYNSKESFGISNYQSKLFNKHIK